VYIAGIRSDQIKNPFQILSKTSAGIQIQWFHDVPLEINILDVKGKYVFKHHIALSGIHTIPVRSLARGIYFLQTVGNKKSAMQLIHFLHSF